MAGTDLQREALDIALRHAPPEVGVHVWCQLVTAKNANGKGPAGQVAVWHLMLTMTDPVNLTGSKLRHMQFIGDGAPNLGQIPGEVERGLGELRTLARQRLATQQ